MDLLHAIAKVLKQLREEKKLSMDKVQTEYGFAKINLSKWENARVQISLVSLESYATKVFNMKASEVIKLAEELKDSNS